MAKPTKKAPAKTAAKPSAKPKTPAKAPVKAAKPASMPAKAAKTAKSAPNAKPKKATEAEPTAPQPAAPKKGLFDKVLTKLGVKASAPAAAMATKPNGKKAKAAKAPKGRRDDEEEFLPEAEDGGGEDLPDLEEFDETEEAVEEEVVDETDADSDDEEMAPPPADDEIILTDAEGRRYCKVKECDQAAMVDSYCRYHYLLLWKRIQVRRKILVDGKLERYVEELTARYPDKFLEMIRRDLKTEKDFQGAIAELEIDESANENEFEDEAQTYIDEVRGVTEAGMSEEEEF